MGIVYEVLHVVPAGAVANDLNKFTTDPPRRCTAIRETRVCLLGVNERRMQGLARKVRRGSYSDVVG